MRILVVEDDFGSRRMMQKLLESYGDVDIVVDGEEAVEAFRMAWEDSKPYKLIFMDIMMPKMDGHEALKRIRELEREMGVKSADEAKVIMTSVLEDPKNVIEAYYRRFGHELSYQADRSREARGRARAAGPQADDLGRPGGKDRDSRGREHRRARHPELPRALRLRGRRDVFLGRGASPALSRDQA